MRARVFSWVLATRLNEFVRQLAKIDKSRGGHATLKTWTNGDLIGLAARHSEFVRQLAKIDKLWGGVFCIKNLNERECFWLASKFSESFGKMPLETVV